MSQDFCDLCLATHYQIIAEASPQHCRIAICRTCGLFFAAPRLNPETLEQFYSEQFTGDAGSEALSQKEGLPSSRKVRTEEKHIKRWALPQITDRFNLENKRVLDIRARSGALSQAMTNLGATVVTLDPFAANVDYARNHRRLSAVMQVPMTRIQHLQDQPDSSYDAITAVTVHLLAHLPSPRLFLENAKRVLKPGGWLFFIEKDVLRPNRKVARPNPFASGTAHQFHLTVDTVALYLKTMGLELIHCAIDPNFSTSQNRVIFAIARKPEHASPVPLSAVEYDQQRIANYLQKVRNIQKFWIWYAAIGQLRSKTHKFLRKLEAAR